MSDLARLWTRILQAWPRIRKANTGSKRPRRRKWVVVLLALVAVAVLAATFFLIPDSKAPSRPFIVTTGTRGGTYNVLGEQFARILERLPDEPIASAYAIQSDGSLDNIERLLDRKADIAFVLRPALTKASEDELERLRALAYL